jgi:alkanesulfonate monooxygenase SsuD/methylene tetrahydromethanopterin reductase-like flavin-dependent oxidoreductase (luciferase family)
MKIGLCSNWGADIAAFRAEMRAAARHGFDVIGIGDSPAAWHDLFLSMAIALDEVPNAIVAPMVSAPFLRHPLVSANAISSLHDYSGGRVAYGLATGGSNVIAMGRGRATQAEVRTEFAALRALLAGEGIAWEGRNISPLRFPRKVPIYYSAFGPKAMELAGQLADGVMLFTGEHQLDELRAKIAAVHAAARAAGRDPAEVDIWVLSFTAVRPTSAEAIEDLKAFISVNALTIAMSPELLAKTPEGMREKILEFHRRYDVADHVVVRGRNVALMEELGLTDYLSRFDTSTGDVAATAAMLRELAAMGVSTFIGTSPGHADPLAMIAGLAAARDAM